MSVVMYILLFGILPLICFVALCAALKGISGEVTVGDFTLFVIVSLVPAVNVMFALAGLSTWASQSSFMKKKLF